MKKFDFTGRRAQLEAVVSAAKDADRKSAEGKAKARAQRKLKCIDAVEDMLSQCDTTRLTTDTLDWLKSLCDVYVAPQHVEVKEGDSLIELLDKYGTVKDLYKKILKQCEEQGLQIQGAEIVKK